MVGQASIDSSVLQKHAKVYSNHTASNRVVGQQLRPTVSLSGQAWEAGPHSRCHPHSCASTYPSLGSQRQPASLVCRAVCSLLGTGPMPSALGRTPQRRHSLLHDSPSLTWVSRIACPCPRCPQPSSLSAPLHRQVSQLS